jgi:hypothetical protein
MTTIQNIGDTNTMPDKQKQNRRAAPDQQSAMTHFSCVGCSSSEEYRAWCRKNGLRDTLNKGVRELQREVLMYQHTRGQDSLRAARQFQRKPEGILRALSLGCYEGLAVEQRPQLRLLRVLSDEIGKERCIREAFLRLLLKTHRVSGFDRDETVVERYGMTASNTFCGGLLALARHHADWRQDPETWRPTSHNPHRQFRDLSRHLLCRYEIPPFLLSAFFLPDGPSARLKQRWLIQVGNGASLRSLTLPITLTKRMAHLAFTKTPENLSVEEGWRWV